ncbi:MAG TPA: glucose-6-phosphate dehydrogenase [Candidatus Levybacteria bacterium]|nr:glucose-6-phosphate dehydrogenase [Candidatus Levybacteria bacterium]
MQKRNLPTVFVIFGATGDLTAKKIAPALFHLFIAKKLPTMLKIIGFARRDLTREQFQEHIATVLKKQKDFPKNEQYLEKFLQHIFYQSGDFESFNSYKELATVLGRADTQWNVCANKLYYLAVPPEYYKSIFQNLADSGLTEPCSPEEGWTRVLVEKPFGKDFKTAEELDILLATLFKEEQIYRIDHYLAKEMLQNILNFRFSNNLFESSWNNGLIESIHLTLHETMGVETRGRFYDGVGALRDVGQNHLLQMLALVLMENPMQNTPEAIRKKRAEVLNYLPILDEQQIKEQTYRAQYDGYLSVDGVEKKSQTETYFKIRTTIDHPRFSGIPITIESGKSMAEQHKEIVITLKHPQPCFCPTGDHQQNKIVIGIEPTETINIHFWNKKPGLEEGVVPGVLNFYYRDVADRVQYVEEYEKLLLDCIYGNQVLFVSTDEIKAMWRFIDPIWTAWQKNIVPLKRYKKHSNEPADQSVHLKMYKKREMKKHIGIVGLGKMGGNVALRLREKGWDVVAYNRTGETTKQFEQHGISGAYSLKELAQLLDTSRVVWVMLPEGKALDDTLFGKNGLSTVLKKGDTVIDAGNSLYKNSLKRAQKFKKLGIHFVDVGVSGGPSGARNGACLMVGGDTKTFVMLETLFQDVAKAGGVQHFPGAGAGHFVKMIHNGIEYGMMQSIAEGFAVLKKSAYNLDLSTVAQIYNNGSVIESRLVKWLENAFSVYGQDLESVSGTVSHTGEGKWTVDAAHEMNIKIKIIEESLKFRIASEKNPSYTGKVLSALRNQFGGHDITIQNAKLKSQK